MDLNLHQRTVVILGPVKGTLQNLVMTLAQNGADVGVVDPQGDQLERFCKTVSDQREISDKNGRAMAVKADFSNWASIKDGMGRVAHSFGSIDMLIDATGTNSPCGFEVSGDDQLIETAIQQNLIISLKAAQFAAGFMKGRKRGRIIFLMNQSMDKGWVPDALVSAARGGLVYLAKAMSKQLLEQNVTVNCMSLGLSEEYLLGHFPEAKTLKEALEKVRVGEPTARMTDSEKVAQAIVFLASNAGASVTGQYLTVG